MVDFHACLEFAGADTHESDTVPVSLIHIGLDLKHKGGKVLLFHGSITPRSDFLGSGREVILRKCCRKVSTPKLVRAEPKNTGEKFAGSPAPGQTARWLRPEARSPLPAGHSLGSLDKHIRAPRRKVFTSPWVFPCGCRKSDLPCIPVINPLKFFSGTDRPVDRTGGDSQLLLNIVQKLKGIHCLPVHLIDKGKDRNMAHDTDLE